MILFGQCFVNFRVTDDDDASTMTGTCTLAVIDVALSVIGYAKQIIVPEAAAEGKHDLKMIHKKQHFWQ